MVDGCPDRWAGAIPVCVLSGSANQDNSRDGREKSLIKERDYIGLAMQPAKPSEREPQDVSTSGDQMDCSNVELRLGLSLSDDKFARNSQLPVDMQGSGVMFTRHVDNAAEHLKLASRGVTSAQTFWDKSFRFNLSSDLQAEGGGGGGASSSKSLNTVLPSVWGHAGVAPGLFTIPVPKVSTTPAKRPYLESVGEDRPSPASSFMHTTKCESAMPGSVPVPAGMYTWSPNHPPHMHPSSGGGWQQVHVSLDQGSGYLASSIGSSFGISRVPTALPPPQQFKVPSVPAASGPPSTVAPMASDQSPSLQATDNSCKPDSEMEQNRSKAPMVGWPPVRTFRKNTLQVAQNNRISPEDSQAKGSVSGGDVPEQVNGKSALFVKAKLDGVRICRKVDLKAYNSYDSLKSALQDMFQGFINDNAKLDLLNGSNYVVTHEDKDGDCLLVGDVPWHMFVASSVKSLRIMKAMDVVGIGDKVSAKLSCKPWQEGAKHYQS